MSHLRRTAWQSLPICFALMQLGALTTGLLDLVALVTPIATGGSPVVDRPEVDEQRTGDGALEGLPLGNTAAILGRVETAAISQFPPTTRVTAAILTTAEESEKKKMLKEAFAEMVEVYELPDDRTRKFQHRRCGSSESPLTYRSALMALAVDAYPDVQEDILDPLVMERMLALAREMGVVLPTCTREFEAVGSDGCMVMGPGS
ncbi:unnamed protein product [Lampetra planeri]